MRAQQYRKAAFREGKAGFKKNSVFINSIHSITMQIERKTKNRAIALLSSEFCGFYVKAKGIMQGKA